MGLIVCAVTASEETPEAARLAVTLADEFDAGLVLAHVVEMPAIAAESVTGSRDIIQAERMLSRLERDLETDAETVVAMGEAGEEIAAIAAARDATLIVVGARKSGLRGTSLRSGLALELAANTTTPVVVAPPRNRAGASATSARRARASAPEVHR